MTVYIFEKMTQAQATGLTAEDTIVFNGDVSALDVIVTPGDELSLATTLTVDDKSLSFPSTALSGATIQLDDGALRLGSNGADAALSAPAGGAVVYGFAGNDVITGGAGADYIFGGADADTIDGGDGNDHLYGNSNTSTQGAADGADSIVGGAGNDYLQGNVGNDVLDGGAGNDRIYGGQGADTITGAAGNDHVNGNLGDDSINGGAGNDILRGGQGNDVVNGGDDNDNVYGDKGDDTVIGGAGFDALFGGEGNDVFTFASTDAGVDNIGGTGELADVVDVIADFQTGDKIDLVGVTEEDGANIVTVAKGTSVTFETLSAALTYAQDQINKEANIVEDTHNVVALDFDGDTYLFSIEGAGETIDTVIKVIGVGAAGFTGDEFV